MMNFYISSVLVSYLFFFILYLIAIYNEVKSKGYIDIDLISIFILIVIPLVPLINILAMTKITTGMTRSAIKDVKND